MSVHPLRLERELRGWSQERLAEMLGVSARTILRWEQGTAIPYPHHRKLLSQLLGKSIEELGFLTGNGSHYLAKNSTDLMIKADTTSPEKPVSMLIDPALPMTSEQIDRLPGRQNLLLQVKAHLLEGCDPPLTALCGLPGIGKTALAMTIVGDPEIRHCFQDGILWGGLGPRPNKLSLIVRWGMLLGVQLADVKSSKSINAWSRAIRTRIGQQRLLIIIDDAWSIEDALTFQIGGPHCAYLLTTRLPQVAFGFAQDKAIFVPELEEADGLALLKRFVPQLVQEDEVTACTLVNAVGGLPLALTLIGKYLATQAFTGQPRRLQTACTRLLNRQQRFSVSALLSPLEYPPALRDGTSISLQDVIAVSEQLLSEPARAMLHSLAVFPAKPNSFSEDAALQVSQQPVNMLDELWDAGLLESCGTGRYTLHQTIADYVRLQGTDEDAERRLVQAMSQYVQTHERDYATIELEMPNMIAAFEAAIAHEMKRELVEGINALMPFLYARGLYLQADNYLLQALQAAQACEDKQRQILLLTYLTNIAELRGSYGHAESYGQQALRLARQLEHWETICDVLTTLSMVTFRRGDASQGLQLCKEGLQLAERLQDNGRISLLLRNSGIITQSQGDYVQAEQHYRRALTLVEQHRSQELVCDLLAHLSMVIIELGDYTQAMHHAQKGLLLAHELGHREHLTQVLASLGTLEETQGNYKQALDYMLEALELARAIDSRFRIASLLSHAGSLAIKLGYYMRAEAYLSEGIDLAHQIGEPTSLIDLLRHFGNLWSKRGDYQAANTYFLASVTLARQHRTFRLLCAALNEWGDAHLRYQQRDAAFATFQEALNLNRDKQHDPYWLSYAQYGLARVTALRGDLTEAHALGEKSLATLDSLRNHDAHKVKLWLYSLSEQRQFIYQGELLV